MSRQEHISLINVDLQENKWRIYTIQITFPDAQNNTFNVLFSWGRLNQYRRTLTAEFEQRKEMDKSIKSILKKRKRNDYQIIDKSKNFPPYPILEEIPVTDNIGGQMKLF